MAAVRATVTGLVVGLGVALSVVVAWLAWSHLTPASWHGGPDRYGAATAVRDDGPHRLRLVGLYGARTCGGRYEVSAGRTHGSTLVVTVKAFDGRTTGACSATQFGVSASVTYSGPHASLVEFAHTPDQEPVLGSAGLPHLTEPGWELSGELRSAAGLWRRCFARTDDSDHPQVCLDQPAAASWRDRPGEERLVVAGQPVRLVVGNGLAYGLVGERPGGVVVEGYHLTRERFVDLVPKVWLPGAQ